MKTSAPLSKVQQGLYAECIAHRGEACYNIPFHHVLDEGLDGERLRRAIEAVVAAHPTLFTRIEVDGEGNPVQTIDDSEAFSLALERTEDIGAEVAGFIRPYELVGERLFRVRLLRDKEHFHLLLDMHHIIADGGSWRVLLADLEKAYAGEPLEREAFTLADVAREEAKRM